MRKKHFVRVNKKQIISVAALLFLLCGTTVTAAASDPIKSFGNLDFQDEEDSSKVAKFYASDLDYLYNLVEDQIDSVTKGKELIANNIKAKDDNVNVVADASFSDLAAKIMAIGKSANAVGTDVLAGKTIYDGDKYVSGTMPNNGGKTSNAIVTATGNTGSVAVPANGYYSTTSKLQVDLTAINKENYDKGKADVAASLTGNAAPSAVLSGYTFYNNSLTKNTGTMQNKAGSSTKASVTTNGNTGTVNIPVNGYYDTTSKLTIDLTANNNSYYQQGYIDGQTDSLNNVEISYTYHKHKGTSSANGGCYTVPVKHVHGDGHCVMGNKRCSCQAGYGWHFPGDHPGGDNHRIPICEGCNHLQTLHSGGNGNGPCTYVYENVCSVQEGTLLYYNLGCGKTEKSIESATIVFKN